MANHTPGPHKLSPDGKYIDSPRGWIVEIVSWPTSPAAVKRGSEEYKANGYLFSRAWSMLALLEKRLEMIEEEAERRDQAFIGDIPSAQPYWTEMRDFANEIRAEIDKAKGKGVSDG